MTNYDSGSSHDIETAQLLRQIRTLKGLSTKDASELVGLAQQTYEGIEDGSLRPTGELFRQMAVTLLRYPDKRRFRGIRRMYRATCYILADILAAFGVK